MTRHGLAGNLLFSNRRGTAAAIAILASGFGAGAQPVHAQPWQVYDVGIASRLQDYFGGHFKRGRALVAADFDLDGRIDFYLGNPGDESFVVRNAVGPGSYPRFEFVQVLVDGPLAWGGSASDYDNDGDYDIYISVGANEGIGFDYLFRNLWMENGQTELAFEDVTAQAGIAGFIDDQGTALPVASANGVWGDVDRDGDNDLFVSVNSRINSPAYKKGQNILWRNNGDGSFTDITEQIGLDASRRGTRNSTLLDIDNDGDLDLFESNYSPNGENDENVLWRNRLVETGTLTFEDVTDIFAEAPFESLRVPGPAFASGTADFNNDGWQDIIVFMRGRSQGSSPYPDGHAIFLNQGGTSFVNVAEAAGINNPFQPVKGVMGCQIGDVNGDGVPDVYIGNGAPMNGAFDPNGGQFNQLFVSTSQVGASPAYANWTPLINFEAPHAPPVPSYPPYPYRTHGTAFVDIDNDGTLEIVVSNGGPASLPATVREPNRVFKFTGGPPRHWLKVRPVGNGTTVAMDAAGTRMAVTASLGGGEPWTVYQTLLTGSAFNAQNGFEVYFGLKNADTIHSLDITWPDGHTESITEGLSLDSKLVVTRD